MHVAKNLLLTLHILMLYNVQEVIVAANIILG